MWSAVKVLCTKKCFVEHYWYIIYNTEKLEPNISFIHSFYKYVLTTYCVLDTIIDAGGLQWTDG